MPTSHMRVVALIAARNERRFIAPCIDHLCEQGVDSYLIDNESSDETVSIAESRLGRGLIGIETFPHGGVYDWGGLLRRKEELASELEADWFIHHDADEFRLPPSGEATLVEALERVDGEGYNAVNFIEFTFIPTQEEPDHDHADFQRTLRTYYPFSLTAPNGADPWALPPRPFQLRAWRAGAPVDLTSSGGHRAALPELKPFPRGFPMKHYLFLSLPHAIEKYVERDYDPGEVAAGWHDWRAHLSEADLRLPSCSELRLMPVDGRLDPSEPRRHHYLERAGDHR